MTEMNSHAPSVGAPPRECAPYGSGCLQSQAVDASMRADLGIARAAAKAESVEPGWCERACEAVRRFAARGVYAEFTMEMARGWIAPDIVEPTDCRAWGRVTRMARDRGYIAETGGYWPAASSNGSPKRVYRKGPKA